MASLKEERSTRKHCECIFSQAGETRLLLVHFTLYGMATILASYDMCFMLPSVQTHSCYNLAVIFFKGGEGVGGHGKVFRLEMAGSLFLGLLL